MAPATRTNVLTTPTGAEFTQQLDTTHYQQLNIRAHHASIIRALVLAAVVLFILNLITVLAYIYHLPAALTMADKFYFDREGNFPSLFSSIILFIAAILLGVIAAGKRQHQDPFASHWRLLSFVFVGLALDELLSVHELLIDPMRNMFQLTGFLRFPWVLAGGAFVLFFGVYYLRFLYSLSVATRIRFMVAGGIYVLGVIGLEMIGGYFFVNIEDRSPQYLLAMTTEETLEIVGILLFIHALLHYLRNTSYDFVIRLGQGQGAHLNTAATNQPSHR